MDHSADLGHNGRDGEETRTYTGVGAKCGWNTGSRGVWLYSECPPTQLAPRSSTMGLTSVLGSEDRR